MSDIYIDSMVKHFIFKGFFVFVVAAERLFLILGENRAERTFINVISNTKLFCKKNNGWCDVYIDKIYSIVDSACRFNFRIKKTCAQMPNVFNRFQIVYLLFLEKF